MAELRQNISRETWVLEVPIMASGSTFLTPFRFFFIVQCSLQSYFAFVSDGKEVLKDEPGKAARIRGLSAPKHTHELNNTAGTYTCCH